MTTCDSVRPWLSAYIDAELPVEEANAVRTHLERCAACRHEWESLVAVDLQLSRAIQIPESLITRCSQVAQESLDVNSLQPTQLPEKDADAAAERRAPLNRRAPRTNPLKAWSAAGVLAAVAAALLILVLPRADEPPARVTAVVVARLVRATGPVQLLSPGSTDWTSVPAESRESIPAGARVRTGAQVLCEIETVAEGTIRLNELAEVSLQRPDRLELLSGQLWCHSPSDATIQIDVDVSEAQAKPPQVATMACPRSSEIECVAGGGFAACGSISPTNAKTSLSMGTYTCPVAPGETVSINSQESVTRTSNLDAPSKIWQLPLLAVSEQADHELLTSVSQLLAPIGMTKAVHLNEAQLRALGPVGAIPLLIYAASESAPEQLELRRKAIWLAGDNADERSIHLLRKLAADADPQIAKVASATLDRIAREAKERRD